MTSPDAARLDRWREVHARHPALRFDCGKNRDPGVRYSEELRDWSRKAATPDQRRIERYIDRYDLRQKRVLHIGIGNSSLAQRFHRRVGEIVGTTIDESDIEVAETLGLPNYRYLIHNKYSGADDAVTGKFDFIVDNNPTSPCCCIRHLATMFAFYSARLADCGQIVTDRIGLNWVPDEFDQGWCFDFDDLAVVARAAGLTAYRMNDKTYVLSRSSPPAPALGSLARYAVRRVLMFPGQVRRNGPRLFSRYLQRLVGSAPGKSR